MSLPSPQQFSAIILPPGKSFWRSTLSLFPVIKKGGAIFQQVILHSPLSSFCMQAFSGDLGRWALSQPLDRGGEDEFRASQA